MVWKASFGCAGESGVREGLGGAETGGEQPEEVAEVAGDHTAITLGTDVDDGLVGDRRIRPYQPEAGVVTRSGRAEEAELAAVDLLVAGPQAKPPRCPVGILELAVWLEITAAGLVGLLVPLPLEADRGHLGQGSGQCEIFRYVRHLQETRRSLEAVLTAPRPSSMNNPWLFLSRVSVVGHRATGSDLMSGA